LVLAKDKVTHCIKERSRCEQHSQK